jgi:hypothetical protein
VEQQFLKLSSILSQISPQALAVKQLKGENKWLIQ